MPSGESVKLSKEEFCERFKLTEDQFFGRTRFGYSIYCPQLEYLPEGCSLKCNGSIRLQSLKELPVGCSLECSSMMGLNSLKELSEGCSLKAKNIYLNSLKRLSENYSIEALTDVYCDIILPTFKGSPEFFFGIWSRKKYFKDYPLIKENPLKFLGSSEPLDVALAEYFLKNP